MSTIIEENTAYKLTQFYGGVVRGKMLEITFTGGNSYLQLTQTGIAELGEQLVEWAAEQEV